MLIEFCVENFRSIKNKVTLSLVASSNKELKNNYYTIKISKDKQSKKDIKLLNSVAIFGANASGKSNLLLALNQAVFFILNSQSFQPNQPFSVEQFRLDERNLSKPTCFEFKFIKNEILYNYSFKVLKDVIYEESLDYYPRGRKINVFNRNKNEIFFHSLKNSNNEDQIRLKIYTEEISKNILILSLANKIKVQAIVEAYSWFQQCITCLLNIIDTGWITSQLIATNSIDNNLFTQLLKCSDPNINRFQLEQRMVPYEELPIYIQLDIKRKMQQNKENVILGAGKIEGYTYSTGIDLNGQSKEIKFLLEENSAGTLKYYGILGQIVKVLNVGGVLIIDELELRLHPNLSKLIVDLFSSEYNKKNAQLIFTTHNTNLLDTQNILRRDQIYFMNKNNGGESELYSLIDFNVRNDKVIQKAYLEGIFGAIPNICLEDLICQ